VRGCTRSIETLFVKLNLKKASTIDYMSLNISTLEIGTNQAEHTRKEQFGAGPIPGKTTTISHFSLITPSIFWHKEYSPRILKHLAPHKSNWNS
jgi:hypothetical protein